MIFHVSNLNTQPLPLIWHKLWEYSVCEWVTPKRNKPSFCLILKLSHPLDGLFSVLSRLHGRKHKCAFCWMKNNKRDYFQILFLGILSSMEPTIYFQRAKDAATVTFHVLVNTYFLNFSLALLIVLRALVHLIYLVIFNNFFDFNFPFFNFEQ